MQTFNYFEQEGNTYKLKVQKGLFYTITLGCIAAIIAILMYSTSKATFLYVAFFAFVGVLGILRTTGVIAFDNQSREIQRKRFFFSTPVNYSFDDFDHFLISKQKSYFITVSIQAIMVMRKNNKTRHILLAQTLFTAKPLQKLSEEISTIMGLTQN
ncbi:hypothetical protein [Pedobacter zeae]|uniref:Uncharacterized protein n=1 Tax=Pedobacter zeae TaxID=1737356 RepID=A0A7W6K9N5_9SPHI|nr:hypothetical protein [Pedobacter zeae]MBB4107650.1 hypothetical protein [Pedobacter zeae]GGG97951.1 hypothetical protein GCM10007422_09990 [Pedobacter zeae]